MGLPQKQKLRLIYEIMFDSKSIQKIKRQVTESLSIACICSTMSKQETEVVESKNNDEGSRQSPKDDIVTKLVEFEKDTIFGVVSTPDNDFAEMQKMCKRRQSKFSTNKKVA
ncbi:hypothetical protein Fmac_008381 [Flemingia macrophylla]|uniref:Uncharacterized protein n=1 Tax=Flemingia macrophylla TaxID=520843 RepID=A0ABD1MXR5_9FABA